MRFKMIPIKRDGDRVRKDSEEGEVSVATPTTQPKGREDYHTIEKLLAYTFSDISWLERALTHRSAPLRGGKNDYERLEFLGDAVLDLVIAHLLSDIYKEAREGELSKMRATLVNTQSLAEIAKRLELGPYIRLGRGELASGGADRPSILADVVEAVVGGVYRDGGYQAAFDCVRALYGAALNNVEPRDPKTELQEALHASGCEAPEYRLECVEGPEHAPAFVSVVVVDEQIVGRGTGTTKKASQQAAAAEALRRLESGDSVDEKFLIVKKDTEPREKTSESVKVES